MLGCQKGELSASDNLINSYLCIHWFFEKVKSRFPTVFQRTSCTLQHSFEVQSTIKSTQYIQKYINVLLDVLCTLFPFLVEKYLFLRVNVPSGVLCTFKSESAKYIQRYKVHPKVQSTPRMHVSINFWELGFNKKGKFIKSIVMCWKPLFWSQPKFHLGGQVCHQCPQNHYCLHIFCMSVSISARVHMFPKVIMSSQFPWT